MPKHQNSLNNYSICFIQQTIIYTTYPSHSWLALECPNKLITENNDTTHKYTVCSTKLLQTVF